MASSQSIKKIKLIEWYLSHHYYSIITSHIAYSAFGCPYPQQLYNFRGIHTISLSLFLFAFFRLVFVLFFIAMHVLPVIGWFFLLSFFNVTQFFSVASSVPQNNIFNVFLFMLYITVCSTVYSYTALAIQPQTRGVHKGFLLKTKSVFRANIKRNRQVWGFFFC